MTTPRYATPQAFKQALEQRLREASASGVDLARRRQLLVFGRFLARVHQEVGDAVILKGGLISAEDSRSLSTQLRKVRNAQS